MKAPARPSHHEANPRRATRIGQWPPNRVRYFCKWKTLDERALFNQISCNREIIKKTVRRKQFPSVGAVPYRRSQFEIMNYVAEQGIKIEYSEPIGSAEGISAGGLIKLKKGRREAEELSVQAHEAAHEMLHRDKETTPTDKKVREAEAEAVAFVVCHGIGLDVNTASSDYIQLYNGDRETLMQSLERIQRTAEEILGAVMADEESGRATDGESCMAVAAWGRGSLLAVTSRCCTSSVSRNSQRTPVKSSTSRATGLVVKEDLP